MSTEATLADLFVIKPMLSEHFGTYLKLNLDNVLKAFFDLWLLESRIKTCKSRMRKDAPFLGIKFADI